MKITSVEILQMKLPEAEVFKILWNPTVIKINTDEGMYGLGEIGLAMGDAKNGQVGLARDYASLIIGMDPFNIEEIWQKLYRTTFWGMGGGGIIFGVISGIDNALWDLKGRALGVPVYQLLGGKTNDNLRTYASQIQFNWDPQMKPIVSKKDYIETTNKALADGYDCVKVNPLGYDDEGRWMHWNMHHQLTNHQIKTAVERVETVRETVGEDVDIIVELHCHTDANTAIQLGRALEPYNILYMEEPTAPLNYLNTKKIADSINIPMAIGERVYSRWGFRPYIEEQVAGLLQPDLGNCGGISEAMKIANLASVYDIGIQGHLCGSPIQMATTLQFEAAISNFSIHEMNNQALEPRIRNSCIYDYQPENGRYKVPDLPGIGQDLTEETYKTADIIVVK